MSGYCLFFFCSCGSFFQFNVCSVSQGTQKCAVVVTAVPSLPEMTGKQFISLGHLPRFPDSSTTIQLRVGNSHTGFVTVVS